MPVGHSKARKVLDCGSPLPLSRRQSVEEERWRATALQDAAAPARQTVETANHAKDANRTKTRLTRIPKTHSPQNPFRVFRAFRG